MCMQCTSASAINTVTAESPKISCETAPKLHELLNKSVQK